MQRSTEIPRAKNVSFSKVCVQSCLQLFSEMSVVSAFFMLWRLRDLPPLPCAASLCAREGGKRRKVRKSAPEEAAVEVVEAEEAPLPAVAASPKGGAASALSKAPPCATWGPQQNRSLVQRWRAECRSKREHPWPSAAQQTGDHSRVASG